ncbi:winged helix-turn-helix domain-containing protein [Streptomyces sp. M19]
MTLPPLSGRITAARLADTLGDWHGGGSRSGAKDLAAAVEVRIRDGRLPTGTRLPPERELAAALGVSRTMIGAALDRLRDAGLVRSRRGPGPGPPRRRGAARRHRAADGWRADQPRPRLSPAAPG